MPCRIVLDTNVLVAGLRSRNGASFQLLQSLGSPLIEVAVSVPLMFEYEDVLHRSGQGLPKSAVRDILDFVCRVAHRQEIHFLWRPFLKDPRDDLVLEVAVASQSSAIVTFNVNDFIGVSEFGIQVLTPGEFLDQVGAE